MTKTEARFWKYASKADGCWLWTGTLGPGGYGRLHHSGLRKLVAAHRFAYELLVGPIPDGLQIDHLCRVHGCVNPAHLEPVTGKENQHRGFSFAGINHRKTHCPRSHPLSGENLYINPKGERCCRTCHRQMRRRERDTPGRVRLPFSCRYCGAKRGVWRTRGSVRRHVKCRECGRNTKHKSALPSPNPSV